MWQPEHTSEEIQEGGKKGQSRRELSERLDVGRSERFGGFSSEHFWIRWAATAGRYEGGRSAQKAVPFRRLQDGGDGRGPIMNESSRSKGVKNVLSLQVARERARQAKAASDRQNSKRSNQRLLERLEAENAQLRDCVVVLMLEIQALHDGAR